MRKIIYILLFLTCSGLVIAQMQKNNMRTMQQPNQMQSMQTSPMMPLKPAGNNAYPPIEYPMKDSTQVVIPSLTINKMNGQSVTATDINLSYNYDLKTNVENTVNFALNIKNINAKNFPTPINGSLNINFNMTNVNLDVLQQIVTIGQNLENENLSDAEKNQIINQIIAVLPKLVTQTTAVTLNKLFTNDKGSITANFALSYPNNAPLPTTVESLFNNLKFSLNLKITAALLDSSINDMGAATTPANPQQMANLTAQQQQALQMKMMVAGMAKQMLAAWVAQGYVTKTGTDYMVTITHENGIYKVNGKVIDLSPFTKRVMPAGPGRVMQQLPPKPGATPRTPPTPNQDVNISPTQLTPIQVGPEPNY